MKKLCLLIAVAAIAVLPPSVAISQELPKATKHENATWYMNFLVRFKPGKVDAANKIITDHFIPADRAVGREVVAYHCKSGRWDMIVFIPLKDGVSDLAWKVSSTDEKWLAALSKTAGGNQKALEVLAQWDDLIADWDRHIVYRPN